REIEAELLEDPSFPELDAAAQRALGSVRVELEARMLELVRLTAPESAAPLAERMRALDPVLLAHAIAFGLDAPALEKQSLLESTNPITRSELLLRVLELQIAEARLPDGPHSVN